jgi:transcriptional regulator NrdR family protein
MTWLSVKDPALSKLEPYKKAVIYKSLITAFDDSELGAVDIENIIDSVEQKIVSNQKSVLPKNELIKIVLESLKPISLSAYINYLSRYSGISNRHELNRLIKSL